LFYFDGETALAACVLRATTKKGKKCTRVTWLEDFLTSKGSNDLTPLLYCAGAATAANQQIPDNL